MCDVSILPLFFRPLVVSRPALSCLCGGVFSLLPFLPSFLSSVFWNQTQNQKKTSFSDVRAELEQLLAPRLG